MAWRDEGDVECVSGCGGGALELLDAGRAGDDDEEERTKPSATI